MSAWIVSEKHILTLAFFYEKMVKGSIKNDVYELEALKKTARVLWSENVKSVNYRYGERSRTVFSKKNPVHPDIKLSMEGLAKAVACWEYQTCEHDGHEKSKAWAMMTELQKAILFELMYHDPNHQLQYDAEKWGL